MEVDVSGIQAEKRSRGAGHSIAAHLLGSCVWLFVICLLAAVGSAQEPKPAPQPVIRRPLPKLTNGARGFDPGVKAANASPRLITVGGGWGAEEKPNKPKLQGKTAEGYCKLGKEYLKRLKFSEAIPPLEMAVKLNPNYLVAYKALGEAYAYDGVEAREKDSNDENMLKRYRQSITAYEQARRLAAKDVDIQLNLGVLYFNTGQYEQAVASFQDGLRLGAKRKELRIPILEDVTLTEIHGFIGRAYECMGQKEKAIESYQEALEVEPDESKAETYRNLGRLFAELGEYDKALASYQKLVPSKEGERVDQGGDLFSAIAEIYVAQKNYDGAAEAFDRAASEEEKDLEVLKQYLQESDVDAETKAKWASDMTDLRTNSAQARYNEGVARLNLDQVEQAVGAFKRALELVPDYAPACFDLGIADLTLGDKEGAREQARLLGSTDPELAKELEGLIGQ